MEVKKCFRCGCFFASSNNICDNCISQDQIEINNLKTYLEENNNFSSVEELSINTGISQKNLNRFLEEKEFQCIASDLSSGIFNINLN